MEFLYTARFLRSLKRLSADIQTDVFGAITSFKNTGNHRTLGLHKLKGRMSGYYAFSANFAYRIIIKKSKKTVYFMDVGDHSVYE